MLFFLGQVLPYLAVTVFAGGLLWKIAAWLKAPAPFQLTLFPAPASGMGRWAAIGREMLLFDSLRRADRTLWTWGWLFHVSLAMIIGGHVVGIYTLAQQFTAMGLTPAGSASLSAVFGTASGVLCFITLLALFYRRTAIPEVRRLSDPADYFELLLLLAIVVSGMHMRLTSIEVDLVSIRAYLGGLLTLNPLPIPREWVFVSHFTLVNLLLLYLPFSKLIHLAGFVVNRALLTQPAPVYPTPEGAGAAPRYGKGGSGR